MNRIFKMNRVAAQRYYNITGMGREDSILVNSRSEYLRDWNKTLSILVVLKNTLAFNSQLCGLTGLRGVVSLGVPHAVADRRQLKLVSSAGSAGMDTQKAPSVWRAGPLVGWRAQIGAPGHLSVSTRQLHVASCTSASPGGAQMASDISPDTWLPSECMFLEAE